jgi:plasmid stability protein
MATLTVRNVPEKVHAALRINAAKNGRSIEAEVREILAAASLGAAKAKPLDPDKAFAKVRAQIRKAHGGKMPTGVVDSFLRERRREWGEEE